MSTLTSLHEATTRLDQVEAAIDAALKGVSYSLGGRSVTRQSLADLQNERTRLIRQIKALQAAAEGISNPGVAVAVWRA